MNEITIRPEMTFGEYCDCRDALRYGKVGPIFFWTVLAIGAASSASSATLTWGTPASLLAGLAFAAFFFFIYIWGGQITGTRRQDAYKRYRELNTSYIFTNERILIMSRHGQSSLVWAAVDRLVEIRTVYLLAVGNSQICVPKRDIPPESFEEFLQLLKTHRLLRQP
jgi:hypothetical protein